MTRSEAALPHMLEAERAVLGSLLLRPELWPEVASTLRTDHFFRVGHERTYAAIGRLAEAGRTVDLLTVRDALASSGDLDEAGGPAYLAALLDGIPRSLNVGAYAGIVREKARLRALAALGGTIQQEAMLEDRPSSEVAERAVQALLAMAETGSVEATQVSDAVGEYLGSLEESGQGAAAATGFTDLDTVLSGGLRPADLAIVAGRPGTGKTSWGLQVALALAQDGQPAVVFALEERRRALAARVVGWLSRVPPARANARRLSEQDLARMGEAWAALEGVPLHLQDAATTLTEVSAWCQRLGKGQPLRCVVVDYLQLLVPHGTPDRHDAVAAVSSGLKRLARDHEVAVVALSQLNRAPDARQDERPHLSDLRDSGALEQDADVAILLHRGEMYKPTESNRGIAEAIVAKHRAGPTGVVRLAWRAELAQFADLAHDEG